MMSLGCFIFFIFLFSPTVPFTLGIYVPIFIGGGTYFKIVNFHLEDFQDHVFSLLESIGTILGIMLLYYIMQIHET